MKEYVVELSSSGLKELQNRLKEDSKWLDRKCDELCSRLASLGAVKASLGFARAIYNGPNSYDITVESDGENAYRVMANGEAVLFVEFGSGLIGYGHPEPHGYGPGTYPGKGHWDDPNGWWYAHGQHSHGNPPNAPMYNAVKEIELELARIAREVLDL